MHKKKLLLFLFSLIMLSVYSQSKEANIWYFGNEAGLNFNTQFPSVITDSKMNQSEGCASIADTNGNLLFYTDGETIWDKTHNIMQNGNNLIGNNSTTQCLILHDNYTPNIYYIFHAKSPSSHSPMYYSVVDISKNNSLGSVITKNIKFWNGSSEKFAAIRNPNNNKDYWLATVDYNGDILIFTINKLGVNRFPKKFSTGLRYVGIGQLKFCSDGTKLAFADWQNKKVVIANFNKFTGVVSNRRYISGFIKPYGIEFSPNSKLLYITDLVPNESVFYQSIIPNLDAHKNSCFKIHSVKILHHFGALQLAPDGKIYGVLSGYQYVNVISFPNNIGGSCGFVRDAIHLKGKRCSSGLPSFSQDYLITKPTAFVSHPCLGDTAVITIFQGSLEIDSIFWKNGSQESSFKFTQNNKIRFPFSDPQNTEVDIRIKYTNKCEGTLKETIKVREPPFLSLGNDTFFCEGNTFRINAQSNASTFNWHNGSGENYFETDKEGKYWVTASLIGCSSTDSIIISKVKKPSIYLGDDTTICDKNTYTINVSNGFKKYLWSTAPADSTPTTVVNTDGRYWVTVTDTNNCQATDSIEVFFKATPLVFLPDTSLCEQKIITLEVSDIYNQYIWSTGSTTYFTDVKDTGALWVRVINSCGEDKATIWVKGCRYDPPVIYIPNAFTPNGDGFNNRFEIYTENIRKFDMKIFNRWGTLVFETKDAKDGWDGNYKGKAAQQDTYMYIISIMGLNNKLNTYFGNFTLIR